jgi:hypothetical protein
VALFYVQPPANWNKLARHKHWTLLLTKLQYVPISLMNVLSGFYLPMALAGGRQNSFLVVP